jgi:hypothetical protein
LHAKSIISRTKTSLFKSAHFSQESSENPGIVVSMWDHHPHLSGFTAPAMAAASLFAQLSGLEAVDFSDTYGRGL